MTLDSGLSLGGGIGGIRYCKDRSNFYYYHYDGSGNVTLLTERDADEIAIYEYDAFGNVLTEAGAMIPTTFLLGQSPDQSCGRHSVRADHDDCPRSFCRR